MTTIDYSIDIGNGYSVISDGAEFTASLQTLYAPIIGTNANIINDRVIEYRSQRFSVGATARHHRHPTLASDKVKLAAMFTLSLLQLAPEKSVYNLIATVPNVEQDAQRLVSELNGTHEYIYNNTPKRTTIRVLSVMNEGYGSYHLARHTGRLPKYGYTLVLDIGSGTTVALVIDNETGAILESFAENLSGVAGLVTDIQSDSRFRSELAGDAVNPAIILRGITNRTFNYGNSGVSFESVYEEHLKVWFQSILEKTLRQFYTRKSEITSYLITGGGSLLVRDKLAGKNRFVLAENPLTDNCFGIAHYARQSH